MWMAELPFTEYLESAVPTTGRLYEHASRRFRPNQPALPDGADNIKDRGEQEQNGEYGTKQKLGGDQFTHKVSLKDEKNRYRPDNPFA